MIPRPRPVERGLATSVDGCRIAWRRYGDGAPAILVVPTWNLVDSRVVGHQVEALREHATVVTYDPRGAGDSDRPPTGYGFDHHAADALAVLDATGIERTAIVTASRGLNAVALLATDQPDRVDRIAVIAPYAVLDADPPPPNPERLERLRTDWPGFIGPFMRAVISEPDSEALIAEMLAIGLEATPEVVAQQELELDWAPAARRLADLRCPVLVLHGEHDLPVPLDHARAITERIPGARLEVIAGGGHRPDIRSPELVNPLLEAFLLGTAGQADAGAVTAPVDGTGSRTSSRNASDRGSRSSA